MWKFYIKFYCRYADDTLLVVKPQDVSRIHKVLNSFDKNLKFTADLFENEVPHFLGLEISSIYGKETNTGLLWIIQVLCLGLAPHGLEA